MVLDPLTLTGFHTWLSILAMLAGIPVIIDLHSGRVKAHLTSFYLAMATLTSVTGFLFPFVQFLPSHGVGIIALIVLAFTYAALYHYHTAGIWRFIYPIGAVITQYLLFFVAIVQAFVKAPSLQAMAPTLSEPPFAIAQGIALLIFAAISITAARAFGRRYVLTA